MTSAVPARRGRASAAGTSVDKAMRILEALAAEDGPHRLMQGFPQSAQVFRELFGGPGATPAS
jgi:hypothetical protein